MFLYQERAEYFVQIAEGMEDLGARELEGLGAEIRQVVFRGIALKADQRAFYRINYLSRLASRVLAPLASFRCHTPDYLYRRALKVPWDAVLRPDATFAVAANVAHSRLSHSQYVALKLKDAVADWFTAHYGRRPTVDRREPQVGLSLHLEHDQLTISLDASGGPLHRRGYRRASVAAPMQETLAAAIVALSGWDGAVPLYDPMCGSGTLLAEALMHYCRVPAGILRRHWGLVYLPDYDGALWREVQTEAQSHQRPLPAGLVAGADSDPAAVRAARANLGQLPGGTGVELAVQAFQDWPGLRQGLILCNPPYGRRSGEKAAMAALYKTLGDRLKRHCAGSTAFIYCGDRGLIPALGLRTSAKIPLRNGELDGRLVRLALY